MDISSISAIGQDMLSNAKIPQGTKAGNEDMFSVFLNSAIESISATNGYLSDAENEEIKFALGETQSTHDLTIALQKASTALQYTMAIRNKVLEAYKEIMQIQI